MEILKQIFLVFALISVCKGDLMDWGRTVKNSFENELTSFFENHVYGNLIKNIGQVLGFEKLAQYKDDPQLWHPTKQKLFCKMCATLFDAVLKSRDFKKIIAASINLCTNMKLGTDKICGGIFGELEDTMIFVLENKANLTGEEVCGTVFVQMNCQTTNPERWWAVELPNVTKPPVNEPPFPKDPVTTLKVLHLADTHFDPLYRPGSNAVCPEVFFCCRAESGQVKQLEDAAGFWGDYRNCDIPKWTLEAMYQHINTTYPEIDFIIWTGDLIPHTIWNVSKEVNIDVINEMVDLVLEYFPGISVYPAVGNHEGEPVNLFPQPYINESVFDVSWLYDELACVWSNWLPSDTATSIAYSAYYSTTIRPGLRIVSINTNYCYGLNWWLVYDSKDVANELKYLAEELQKAEDAGDRVFIVGHIAPGDPECEFNWSHQFNRIVSRYEDTVSGMFYGHTHNDHYEIFFDQDNASRPYDVAYIAQSQTPYKNLNPGYKIYTIEGDFEGSRFRVLDHENWILDLDKTNKLNKTHFYKLYSAKENYRLTDLSPKSLLDLVIEMRDSNSTLFNDFYRNYVKAGRPSLEAGCDDNCKSKILCELLTADRSNKTQCQTFGL